MWLAALLILALGSARAATQPDQYTPLLVSAPVPHAQAFLATDGRRHLVYELLLTNASPTAVTLKKVDVVDGLHPSKVLVSYSGSGLLGSLRTMGATAVKNPVIEFNGSRLLLLDLDFDANTALPIRLLHRFELTGASSPARVPVTPVALSYTAAPVDLPGKVPEIGPPLAGRGWLAVNGCCGVTGVHRSSSLACNGRIFFSQRFAIDWMRLDDAGRLVKGDPSNVRNYTDYGASVLAVADGVVVETLDTLQDQKPGALPDPKTITIQNVDGNHIILDLGHGIFAFYAHLEKGSILVSPGDHVRRGQVLAKLGNTGNTSAPHLHFHLMDGPSALCSSGLPYSIDSFNLEGHVSAAKFAAAETLTGDWREGLARTTGSRRGQYPLDLTVVDFHPPGQAGAGAR